VNQYLNYRNIGSGVRLVNRFHGAQHTDLIVAFDGRDDRGTKASRDADAKPPNHAADEDIPNHVIFPPSSRFEVSQGIREAWIKPSGSHLGATKTAMTTEATIMMLPNTTNPTARNNF